MAGLDYQGRAFKLGPVIHDAIAVENSIDVRLTGEPLHLQCGGARQPVRFPDWEG